LISFSKFISQELAHNSGYKMQTIDNLWQ